jgi:hypothetical protein
MGAIPNFVPKIWAGGVLRELENNLIAKQICSTKYEGEIRGKGDTVFFNGLADPTISSYTGTISSYEEMADAQIALLIDQQDMFGFKLDDVDKVQANVDVLADHTRRAGYGLANNADKYILGLHADAGNTVTATVTSANVFSTVAEIGRKLDENNVPMQDRHLVVPPWFAMKLKLAGVKFSVNDGLKGGKGGYSFAEELGFKIYVSNNIVDTATTPVSKVIAVSSNAIVFASQLMKVESGRLEGAFADYVRGLHVYGAKVIKPKEMVTLTATYGAETTI